MTDRSDTPPQASDDDPAAGPDDAPTAVDSGGASVETTSDIPPGVRALIEEQRDKHLRLAAEFDNFRKRAARDREHAEHHGQSIVIRGMLEALDDLSRFAHIDPATSDVRTVVDGAAMVEQKLLKSLAGHGLELVNPLGAPFDPALHEAVATAPAETPDDDHLVAQVFQVGYVFNGKLLRPARVVVKQWAD
jgi:molecular chaperone GrpE